MARLSWNGNRRAGGLIWLEDTGPRRGKQEKCGQERRAGRILTSRPNCGDGQSRTGVWPAGFKRRPRLLYIGGAMVLSFADPTQRQCWRGRRWAPKNSWQEARGFNHRSTDIKSAGARMSNMPDSGAKSSLHRRKVGGGNLAAGSRCALCSLPLGQRLAFRITFHDCSGMRGRVLSTKEYKEKG